MTRDMTNNYFCMNHTYSIFIIVIIYFMIANDYFSYQCTPDAYVLVVTSNAAVILESTRPIARTAMTTTCTAISVGVVTF